MQTNAEGDYRRMSALSMGHRTCGKRHDVRSTVFGRTLQPKASRTAVVPAAESNLAMWVGVASLFNGVNACTHE